MENIDNYQKIKVVGQGTFGQAVLVKCKLDGNQYIMKQITVSSMSVKEKQEALNEVRVLSTLKHPNVVQYLTSFQAGNKLCIVMEYAEGGDLFEKIKNQRGRLFSEGQIIDWFIQICLSVKHCHDRRILHRDLKTQNIFLTSKNTIKLGDFGIARVLRSTMEHARTLVGTPYYLSPELCAERPYNNKSDIWSLGCVLYELTTLKHAFEGLDMKALIGKILRGIYPPISSQYSKDLRDLIDKCLQKDPRNRPSITSILNFPFIKKRMEQLVQQEPVANARVLKPITESRPQTSQQPRKEDIANCGGGIKHPFASKQEVPRDPVDQMKLERAKQHMEAMKRLKQYKDQKVEVVPKPSQPVKPFEVHVDQQYRERREKDEKQRQEDLQRRAQQDIEAKKKQQEAMLKKREEELLKRKKEQEDYIRRKKREQEIELQKKQQEEQIRKKREEEAYIRMKKIREEEERRKIKEEEERKKSWENARQEAARNKQRYQVEAKKEDIKERPVSHQAQVADRKKEEKPVASNTEDPLAEYRRQQYWEARKAKERYKARAEAEANGVPYDEGSDVVPVKQNSKDQKKEEQLSYKDAVTYNKDHKDLNENKREKKEKKLSQGADEEKEYKKLLRTMIGKLNEEKDQIQDCDDIFTGEEGNEDLGANSLSSFKLNGKTLRLKNVSDKDTLCYRIEALRKFLGDELGEETFLKVYKMVESQKQNDDDDVLEKEILKAIGNKQKMTYVPLIHQLIFCEEAQFSH